MNTLSPSAFGWIRDSPDHRDFGSGHQGIRTGLASLRVDESEPPAQVDLREFFPLVRDQSPLRSCAAHACLGLVEYFEHRASGNATRFSRLFLYKTTRRLMHMVGDTGADLRTTLKAIARFGLPPEEFFPYDPANADVEPDPFVYSVAWHVPTLQYYRLDMPGVGTEDILQLVRAHIAAGLPSVFGFPVSVLVGTNGDIPLPRVMDSLCGGQAMVAAGYDDHRRVGGAAKGALLVRSSWGQSWGEEGYGWLPYDYILRRLAVDFWTILAPSWLASGEFTRPTGGNT